MTLAVGVLVQVTQGAAKGVEGVITAKWPRPFGKGGPALWVVRSEDLVRSRVLRGDWLLALGVKE